MGAECNVVLSVLCSIGEAERCFVKENYKRRRNNVKTSKCIFEITSISM